MLAGEMPPNFPVGRFFTSREKLSDDLNTGTVFIKEDVLKPQLIHFAEWDWTDTPGGNDQQTIYTRPLKDKLDKLQIAHEIVWEPGPGEDTRERVEAVNRWFVHDWQTLDNKIKSSIVEGVSVFLAMFDMPDVAKVFCPAAPLTSDDPQAIILQAAIKRAKAEKDTKKAEQPEPQAEPAPEAQPEPEANEPKANEPKASKPKAAAGIVYTWGGQPKAAEAAASKPDPEPVKAAEAPWEVVQPVIETDSDQAAAAAPPLTKQTAPITQHLPPLFKLIEQGKVLALNMPAGINPALSRAVGVMLKNAWLQALLMRPAKMKHSPGQYFRPAVFICDEYQAFASVGEDDPSGDEKSFALTRQCRCIPIVATQSISSLRAVLGSSEAWRSLLQTLRTRIFLSLSDDASAKIASELCGQVAKIKESYTISETSKRSEVSPLSGRAGGGGGSMGATKSFREQREAVFHPRDFALLSNCQAICLPYDGAQSLEPRRVYLKPHYLPAEHSYWRAKEAGQI